MRKTILAAFVAIAFATPAVAQSTTFGFGAHAGVSIPTGDYADAADLGFLGGLDLMYPLMMVTPGLSWYSSVDAIAHGAASDGVDGGFLYFPLMTGLRFDIPAGPVGVFINGQLGLIFNKGPDVDALGVTADGEFTTNFGFSFGGGVQATENVYAGLKYYPLGELDFAYSDTEGDVRGDVSFLDIYIGFGVF